LFDVGLECFAIHGAFGHKECGDPLVTQCCDEGNGLPVSVQHFLDKPFTLPCSAVQTCNLPTFGDSSAPAPTTDIASSIPVKRYELGITSRSKSVPFGGRQIIRELILGPERIRFRLDNTRHQGGANFKVVSSFPPRVGTPPRHPSSSDRSRRRFVDRQHYPLSEIETSDIISRGHR
jgi:hypothetical protein